MADTKIVCQSDTRSLVCPSGKTLNILSADWGRTNNVLCRNNDYAIDSDQMNPTTPCSQDVTAHVQGWYAST